MARIILKNNEYSLYDFDNETECEKIVIENQRNIIRKDDIYIYVKKRGEQDIHYVIRLI